MPALPEQDPRFKLKEHIPLFYDQKRRPAAVALSVGFEGASLPHPDCWHSKSTIQGLKKRMLLRMPRVDKRLRSQFRRFCHREIKRLFVPLDAQCDLTVETWLQKTHYPEWRKEQLRAAAERVATGFWDPKWTKCKSFIKDEFYDEFKYPRTINSRSDEFKVIAGPVVKAIEEVVYKLENFIKHVPKKDLAAHLQEYFGDDPGLYEETDFSSFEAGFSPEIIDDVEIDLYRWMTQFIDKQWAQLMGRTLEGVNVLVFKVVTAYLKARRMSGEMSTSLGNGLTNYFLIAFAAYKKRMLKRTRFKVEGDDGAIKSPKPMPGPEFFARLGFVIKMHRAESLSGLSFCGQVFDAQDLALVTSPLKRMLLSGWSTSSYAESGKKQLDALLRAKALSLGCSYPGCPVLQSYSLYVLRVTRHVRMGDLKRALMNGFDSYHIDQMLMVNPMLDERVVHEFSRPVGSGSRLLVQEKYGFDIASQLLWEKEFDECTTMRRFPLDQLLPIIPNDWIRYWSTYVVEVTRGQVTDNGVAAVG